MKKLSYYMTLLVALVLAACGGDNTLTPGAGGTLPGGGPGAGPAVAGVTVLVSSPSLPSDTGQSLTVSVVVRDTNNVAMQGVTVIMSTDSGTLTVDSAVTDTGGIATATLNSGSDPTPRTITVTADAQGVLGTVSVDVVGTTLSITGPNALAQGDSATYTIVLTDASGDGIGGQTVDITSGSGNTLASASLTTDVSGQAQVNVTASAAGADTLTATALGIMATAPLNVSNDNFVLTAPVAGDQIVLNTPTPVTLTWDVGGVAQAGQTITFSSTRGTLSNLSAITDAAGVAGVSIQSTNAGPAVITARNSAGTSTQVEVQFIADVPDSIEVQASPFTIGPNEQSAVTAIVRDAANNLVSGADVQFDLLDVTGGQLSVASAKTDLQGRATTFYTSSQTTSANEGVIITATVQGTVIADSVALTVAQREVFISIGTGNSIFEHDTATYRQEFVVLVTDSQGNGVSGVPVQVGVLSDAYYKGFWFYDALASQWVQSVTVGPCIDEDINNRNGVLDPGEDFNGSQEIEAGNIASVAAQGVGGGTVTTNQNGQGVVDLFYPQNFARWVDVTLRATTSVQGTEFAESSIFRLRINADDVDDENTVPPGDISPFGDGDPTFTCADTE